MPGTCLSILFAKGKNTNNDDGLSAGQVLSTLSQEHTPANPLLRDIIRDLSVRAMKKKTFPVGLLGSIVGSPSVEPKSPSESIDPLLAPFVTAVFEALGDTAARCEDLGLMLDLVKCKPFFLRKLCIVIAERIDPDAFKSKLSSLLDSSDQRCLPPPFSPLPPFSLWMYVLSLCPETATNQTP